MLSRIIHQLQTIRRPTQIPFRCYLHSTLTTREEEIVEQELIEMLCCRLGNLLHHLPMLRVRVAERLKLIALVDSEGDTASHLDALFLEELLRLLNRGIIHNMQVTMRLQVDLIHIQLTGDRGP